MDQLTQDRERLTQLLKKAEEIEKYIEHLEQESEKICAEQRKFSDVLEVIYDDIDVYRHKTNNFD